MNKTTTFQLPERPTEPQPILTTDEMVQRWIVTPGFQAFWAWIRRRCDRVKGKEIMRDEAGSNSAAIKALCDLLEQMERWVDEIPAEPQSNQRFGNLAFRKYYKLIEERIPLYFDALNLPPYLVEQGIPLLLNSTAFGQPTRLDYGTGHELAFVLFLWLCVASGWAGGQGADKEEEEDELILRVFPRYLDLVTKLQMTYKLEPAGSHGVWGLDDYCFLPYLFGSAQLLGSPTSPSSCLATALSPSSTPTHHITDLYTLSLRRVTLFKHGASFSEHSPLLYSLSQMPDWKKPHEGLRKMFLGEVVGKRVVVQGVWLGGWLWGEGVPRIDESEGPDLKQKEGRAEWGQDYGTGREGVDRNGLNGRGPPGEATKAPWA